MVTTNTTTFFKGAALCSLSLLLFMFITVSPAFSQERSGEILKQLEKKGVINKSKTPKEETFSMDDLKNKFSKNF